MAEGLEPGIELVAAAMDATHLNVVLDADGDRPPVGACVPAAGDKTQGVSHDARLSDGEDDLRYGVTVGSNSGDILGRGTGIKGRAHVGRKDVPEGLSLYNPLWDLIVERASVVPFVEADDRRKPKATQGPRADVTADDRAPQREALCRKRSEQRRAESNR